MSDAIHDGRRLRVVVCGTTFGRFYLAAFGKPDFPFQLTGVLARGSDRSRACAARYGVPLLTAPEQIPDDTDIACVVVRSGAAGGEGGRLALSLLARGIHVLQEHPVHHDELAACLTQAGKSGTVYRLNTLYPNLAPVRAFLAAARALRRRQPLLFVEAACAVQVAYPMLDILATLLGGIRPWALAEQAPPAEMSALAQTPPPFRSLDGVLGGVACHIRVQNELDPADPDNHIHLLHRVVVGTEGGSLILATTHGPVLWSPALHVPEEAKRDFAFDGEGSAHLGYPSATPIGPPDAPSYRTILSELWPAGVARALHGMREEILGDASNTRHGQYHLALCKLWQDATARLGYPELRRHGPTHVLPVDELAEAAKGELT